MQRHWLAAGGDHDQVVQSTEVQAGAGERRALPEAPSEARRYQGADVQDAELGVMGRRVEKEVRMIDWLIVAAVRVKNLLGRCGVPQCWDKAIFRHPQTDIAVCVQCALGIDEWTRIQTGGKEAVGWR